MGYATGDVMSNAAIVVLVLGGLAYAVYAVPAMIQFFAYCDQISETTGRVVDNATHKSQDDGGLNFFQLEQYRRLRSGEFMQDRDVAIVARGTVVAHKLRISFWAAVGLLFSVPWTYAQSEAQLSISTHAYGAAEFSTLAE